MLLLLLLLLLLLFRLDLQRVVRRLWEREFRLKRPQRLELSLEGVDVIEADDALQLLLQNRPRLIAKLKLAFQLDQLLDQSSWTYHSVCLSRKVIW